MAVMWAHITEDPPPVSSSPAALQPDADEVFARVLAKDPANRFPNCQMFADALRQALGIQPYAVSSARIDRPATALAAAAAVDQPKISAPELVPAQASQSADGAQDSGHAPATRRRRRRKVAVAASNAIAGELSHPATLVVDSEPAPPSSSRRIRSSSRRLRSSSRRLPSWPKASASTRARRELARWRRLPRALRILRTRHSRRRICTLFKSWAGPSLRPSVPVNLQPQLILACLLRPVDRAVACSRSFSAPPGSSS